MDKFWLAFLPIFMAVNAISLLPFFISFTAELERGRVRRTIVQSVITATIVAVLFLLAGSALLNVLGITVADFLIAGGALLFVIALDELLASEKKVRLVDTESLGAVPLGVPLIVGPAVLTTTLMLEPQYGFTTTVTAIVCNILIAGGMFWLSTPIIRFLGTSGVKTISKIGDILLAAIAVMMVRKGIVLVIAQYAAR